MYKQIKNFDGTVSTTAVKRTADDAFIPIDQDNRDCQEYLKWLEAGNTPEPADQVV